MLAEIKYLHPEATSFLLYKPAPSLKCSDTRQYSFSFKGVYVIWGQTDQEVGWSNLCMTAQIILLLTAVLGSWLGCWKPLGNQWFDEPEKPANTTFTKDALGNFCIISFYVQQKRDLQGLLWRHTSDHARSRGKQHPTVLHACLFSL